MLEIILASILGISLYLGISKLLLIPKVPMQSGDKIYWVNSKSNKLEVRTASTNELIETIKIGIEPKI